jgi:DNA-binding response OmpR family regulator
MYCRLNILVVEDNDEFRHTLLDILSRDGHRVSGVDCAEAVAEQSASFELVLIDLNLPGEDGLALARRLRRAQPNIGIIMVTARQLPGERVDGYASGADLYLPKPVDLNELRAAIVALSRRLNPEHTEQALWLNPKALRLEGLDGTSVDLSAAQTRLLQAFARAAEQRLENWQLIELLEQHSAHDPKAALELQIVRLRKKLTEAGAPSGSIKAIRNWGYALSVALRLNAAQ